MKLRCEITDEAEKNYLEKRWKTMLSPKTPNHSSETDYEEEASGSSNPSTNEESNNDYMSDYSYNSKVSNNA